MDTETLSEKKTSPFKARTERLPLIEVKKVKGKTYCKKSANTLLKPKLSFPKLKSNEIPQQRADAGDLGSFHSEILNQETNSPLAPSASGVNSLLLDQNAQISPKVIGISECQFGFKIPSSELFFDDTKTDDKNLEESRALKRWKFWLRDKKRMQNVLSKKLKRDPCDLQLQESDKYRAILEDKMLLTYAQIPKPDKWRGHPYYWKERLKLGPKKVAEDCEIPDYIAVETKADRGELPEMEFIGIPGVIQKEKNPICKMENVSLKKWEKMPYRQEQVSYFKEQRKKMKPHNILMEELAVVGVKISREDEESKSFKEAQSIPEIIITEENSEPVDFRQSIFCLAIDGEEIKYELGTENCQNPDRVFTWRVDFGTNKIGSLVEKVLRIENRGTIAVAYDWISKKNDHKPDLEMLQLKPHEPWFFFNKNSGLFVPGQIYEMKFYHHSDFSGIRKEVWYLKTKPPLWQNVEMCEIILSAVATENFSCKKYSVESFLRKRVRDAVIRFTFEFIFYKVFNPSEGLRQIEYRSFFNEKELFEYHNPKHYFHSTIVKELNGLFDEISVKNQTEWDFSLDSLFAVVKSDIKGKEKSSLLKKLALDTRRLFRPNYLHLRKCNKFKMTYETLCKMASFIEEDYDYIKNLLFKKKKEYKSFLSFQSEETSEEEFGGIVTTFEIKPMNFIFFQTMLYLKVYTRLCEAVESIAGLIETNRLLVPWRNKPMIVKPRRK